MSGERGHTKKRGTVTYKFSFWKKLEAGGKKKVKVII